MNKLVRYWNQNRRKIILWIAIIAFIIIIVQVLNSMLKNTIKSSSEADDLTLPIQSVITGATVSEEVTKENTDVIKNFVTECNNRQYENAYALLSNDCKEVVFNNDINNFINNYCNKVFEVNKIYNIQLYLNQNNLYMYKVTFYNGNFLTTGNANLDENIQDYITVKKEKDEDKININGFIKKQQINKSVTKDEVEISINYKNIYKNYETYDITINNYSQKTIKLSEKTDGNDISIEDSNAVEYDAYIYEIPIENLIIKNGDTKSIQIKFNKLFSVYRNIVKVKFKNIIKDYDYYTNNPNSNEIQKIETEIEI